MPRFETMPKPKVEAEEEEAPKVVDKRVVKGPEGLKRIDEEIKAERDKKRFDAMTPEQREEWEYNRDKERGFTVRDKRGVANIENYRAGGLGDGEPEPVAPLLPQQPEQSAPVTPPIFPPEKSVHESLKEQAREIRGETSNLRLSVDNIRGEIAKTEKALRLKYGGPAGRKIITLESSALKQKLMGFYIELENKLSNLAKLETNIYGQESISKEISEIRQKLFNLKSESQPAQKARHPLRFLKKLFGR